MPLLKPVSRAEASAETNAHYDAVFGAGSDPEKEPGTSTGTPGNWHTIWARVPEIFKSFSAYRVSTQGSLSGKLWPLASMRTGYLRRSQFVLSQQSKMARGQGIEEDKIKSISFWSIAPCYSDLERAILAFTDSIIIEGGRTPPEIVEKLKTGLSEKEILELAYVIKNYDMHASLCASLRLEYDDVPERVVEIPKPATPRMQNHRDPSSW